MAPSPTGTASCMYCPRRRTVRRASAKDSVPAATCAEYSPRLWPAAKAARIPRDSTRRHAATLAARIAGWVFSVSSSCSSGPSKHSRLNDSPSAASASSNVCAADGKRVGQRLAHADFLRALPRKNECNHRVETTSRASLSSRPSLTHLTAIATALRTALTDERPWPIMQRPLRPTSGAPPYSE